MRPPQSTALAWMLLLLAGVSSTGAAQKFLAFDQVRKGMRGYGLSVFEGTRVEEFPAEVIGLLPNIAPGRNLFLVRLSGERAEAVGVPAGMSGSPIYLEGALAGAIAYTWGFAREPVAGVTPIHEMLDLLEGSPRAGAALHPAGESGALLRTLLEPDRLPAFFSGYFDPLPAGMPFPALPVPLAGAGIDLAGNPALARPLERIGLVPAPITAGAAPAASPAALPSGGSLKPGSAVAVKLIRGDLELSAVGTATHVEGDRVLAFGHPLLNLGAVDLPMALAEVQTVLPSFAGSLKFANPRQEIGRFQQDRMPGLAGQTGREPELLPVRLEMELPGGRSREFRFELVRTPYLSPYLLYLGLNSILSSAWRDFGEATVEILEGSTFLLPGLPENVSLRNRFSGPTSPLIASATVAFLYHILMSNEYEPARIAGVNLRLRYAAEPRVARIDRVWLDRGAVRPGESVNLNVGLRPYRLGEIIRTLEIRIPEEVRPGRLRLQVGDSLQITRGERSGEILLPRDLDQLVLLINHLRTNDRVYVLLSREGQETVIRGERLSGLPPSRASILLEPRRDENLLSLREQRILEDSIETDFVIQGRRSLFLDVE
ncbi:MAG: hypothetical protein HY509_01515 [Acidobacteria bacterium]|nr:hypothetical protein [Acidobacteriota bacterium]